MLIDAYTSKCGLIDSFKANGQSRAEAEAGIAPARYTHQPRLLIEANRAQYLASSQPQPQSSPAQNSGNPGSCGCAPGGPASRGGATSGGEGDAEAEQERKGDSAAAVEAIETAQEERRGSASRQGLLGGRSPSLASTSATSASTSLAKKTTASGAAGDAASATSETASAGGRRPRGRQAQQAMQLVRAVVPQRKPHTLTDAVHLLSTKPFEQKLLMYVHVHKPGHYLSKCASKNLPFDESRFRVPCFAFINFS